MGKAQAASQHQYHARTLQYGVLTIFDLMYSIQA
jgi:hypothetical protein